MPKARRLVGLYMVVFSGGMVILLIAAAIFGPVQVSGWLEALEGWLNHDAPIGLIAAVMMVLAGLVLWWRGR